MKRGIKLRFRMIYLLLIMLFLLMIITSCGKSKYKYEDGEYIGQGQGHHSVIKVKVLVNDNKITSIDIIEEEEIPGLKEIVYEKIPKTMKKKNTWEVDEISGATLTSNGLIEAVKDALKDVIIL